MVLLKVCRELDDHVLRENIDPAINHDHLIDWLLRGLTSIRVLYPYVHHAWNALESPILVDNNIKQQRAHRVTN